MQNFNFFTNNEFGGMRTYCDPATGEVWFCLVDICKALDLSNPSRVKARLEDEKGVTKSYPLETNGGTQNTTFVNESGLYEVFMRSNSPKGKPFRRWIYQEVLPSIRKHGVYISEEVLANEEKLKEKIEAVKAEYKEKVAFADAFLASEDSAYIGVFADYLIKNGIKMGKNQLFKWFKEKKILIMHGDEYFPSARYLKMGLFDLEATTISKTNGKTKVSHTVKITPKGMQYFLKKMQVNKAKKTGKQINEVIQLTLFN